MKTTSSAELRLTFSNPRLMVRDDNTERVVADAQMVFAQNGMAVAQSEHFPFIAPIGLLDADDIKWYLESYYIWPVGLFKERAERIERYFPQWGDKLLTAITASPTAQPVFQQWLDASSTNEPVFSLHVQVSDTPESKTAASRLLGFPWELLRYHDQYLLTHNPPVRIRRNLPRLDTPSVTPYAQNQTVLRVLAVSPRPSQAGYIDHRASIKPLVEAVEILGKRVELVRVNPPTFEQLKTELRQAQATGKPFHVLHFDGHGVFDTKTGRGALCFEHPLDNKKLLPEFVKRIYADDLAALLTEYPLPLVFLEACQTGQSEAEKQEHTDPNASVAAALLQAGVASVIAMSHSVLVETARRFVSTFYQQLAEGQRIGSAVLAGRQALMESTDRINIAGAGTLQMQDWFVPVLYQREDDPRLFSHALQLPDETESEWLLGDLPETPKHTFIGRSRDLLKLERLLDREPYAVIRGMGGIGKTAVAVELARWLVQCRRFERCAFVSVETYTHERAIVDILGKQLADEKYSVAEYGDDLDAALQPIMQVLQTQRTLLIIDNMESLLADVGNTEPVLALANTLLKSSPQTRLLFTTREPLPAPFNHTACDIELGALSLSDAKVLVMQVMNNEGLHLHHDDQGNTPEEVDALVNSVGCHARALVLLARELAQTGVTATTENLRQIIITLEKKHPGNRENSLFASVELSWRRLPPLSQKLLKGLAVFHDGGTFGLPHVLGVDNHLMWQLQNELLKTGLVTMVNRQYAYLRFDPALPHWLDMNLTDRERNMYLQRWEDATEQLIDYLYKQRFENTKLASELTLLELPNIMAFLRKRSEFPQKNELKANNLLSKLSFTQALLENIDCTQALKEIINLRQYIEKPFNDEGLIHFESELQNIEILLSRGDFKSAFDSAQYLSNYLTIQLDINKDNKKAKHHLPITYFLMGRALKLSGNTEESLFHLKNAQTLFEINNNIRMSIATMTDIGDCLQHSNKFSEAESLYLKSIDYSEKTKSIRDAAVARGQLARVYNFQRRFPEALLELKKSIHLFDEVHDVGGVATTYYQMGMLCRRIKNYSEAENYYRKALVIFTRLNERSSEANCLAGLGNVYDASNLTEQAIGFYRESARLSKDIDDKRHECIVRGNLGNALIKLKCYEDARKELIQAIDCGQYFNSEAELWRVWGNLYTLEKAENNSREAWIAWQEAVKKRISYRLNGGENNTDAGDLCEIFFKTILHEGDHAASRLVAIELADETWGNCRILLNKLAKIALGERSPKLAEDEQLHYEWAAEVLLVLDRLRKAGL